MALWFLVLFATPVVEMYLLIRVGGYIGALPTVALVLLTAVAGVFLLRRQGLSTLARGLRRMDAGQVPAREMAEGLLLAVAGALLVTPGFVTDAVGFALVWPPLRVTLAARLLASAVGGARPGGGPIIIEGEFESREAGESRRPGPADDDDQPPPPLNSPG
ncbi:MAG: FxsA family protein [Pseudomonadales bacterium]